MRDHSGTVLMFDDTQIYHGDWWQCNSFTLRFIWLQYLLEVKLYTHSPNDAYKFNVIYENILYILLQPKFSIINS